MIPALLLPIAVHELSHALAIRALGLRIRGLRLEPCGLCIVYSGACPDWKHAAASLAGPFGGLVYALLARAGDTEWLCFSADVSLVLSLFNLLPIMPLDGGRAFLALCRTRLGEEDGPAFFERLERGFLALALLAGVALIRRGSAPLLAGLWLLLLRRDERGTF